MFSIYYYFVGFFLSLHSLLLLFFHSYPLQSVRQLSDCSFRSLSFISVDCDFRATHVLLAGIPWCAHRRDVYHPIHSTYRLRRRSGRRVLRTAVWFLSPFRSVHRLRDTCYNLFFLFASSRISTAPNSSGNDTQPCPSSLTFIYIGLDNAARLLAHHTISRCRRTRPYETTAAIVQKRISGKRKVSVVHTHLFVTFLSVVVVADTCLKSVKL